MQQGSAEHEEIWQEFIARAESSMLNTGTMDNDVRVNMGMSLLNKPTIMTASDITAFMDVLADSHDCNVSDIVYYFEPIIEDGELLSDVLKLVFTLKSIVDYEVTHRVIHTITVSVPQEVLQLTGSMKGAH